MEGEKDITKTKSNQEKVSTYTEAEFDHELKIYIESEGPEEREWVKENFHSEISDQELNLTLFLRYLNNFMLHFPGGLYRLHEPESELHKNLDSIILKFRLKAEDVVASNFGVRVLNSLNRPYGKTPEQIKIDKEILEKRLGLFKFLFIEMRKLGYKRGELTT